MLLAVVDSPWYINEVEILIRLIIALVLGGIIGFEREQANHAAGFRTNILVCVGACLLMLLSIYGFSDFVNEVNVRVDPARLAAAVITGVGFLGAGTILFTGKKISGLTTAASLWVVAAIGLAVGAGFYFASIAVMILVVLTLWLFNKLEARFIRNKQHYVVNMTCSDQAILLLHTQQKLDEHHAILNKMSIEEMDTSDIHEGDKASNSQYIKVILHIHVSRKHKESMLSLVQDLKQVEGVRWIGYE
ncbi:MAG TPA: MgtC/SapB family protein [Candidatus Paenibacillus intestinavium]|nr:MgtC/SapB family protein [Candidatus Paenibacillus intestinavium]